VSVQLVSKISKLCDPDPPTSQTDRQTDGRHAISIPRYALVHRAVKTLRKLWGNFHHRIFYACAMKHELSLHWLPTQQRIQYKVALITYMALSTLCPAVPRRTVAVLIKRRRGLYGPLTFWACLFQGHILRQLSQHSVWQLLTGYSLEDYWIWTIKAQPMEVHNITSTSIKYK